MASATLNHQLSSRDVVAAAVDCGRQLLVMVVATAEKQTPNIERPTPNSESIRKQASKSKLRQRITNNR